MTVTRDEFQFQFSRLIDAFGDKGFSEQRELMIWSILKNLPYVAVIGIVDNFIRCAKYPPLPADFSEAVSKCGVKGEMILGDIQEIAKCQDCDDSGFVRLERLPQHDAWAKWIQGSAPCHCNRGSMLIEAGKRMKPKAHDAGPQFNDYWRRSYRITSEAHK